MRVFAEKGVEDYTISKRIINRAKEIIPLTQGLTEPLSPKDIYLFYYKGSFIKSCPGTKNYLCCGYRIFHFAEGCPLGCSYCVLQAYFSSSGSRIIANTIEDGLAQLSLFLKKKKEEKRLIRLGTGEFTDSLVFEPFLKLVPELISLWKTLDPLAILELKTKTAPPEEFYNSLPSDGRIIFAWSVNTEKVISQEERYTASLAQRFRSAEGALKRGFSLAFHFDPIILYEGAEEEYSQVLEEILNLFPLNRIAWISLGTLRFPAELKEIAIQNFPQTKIYAQEFIRGLDQKYRYFVERRIDIYTKLLKNFAPYLKELPLYFCMEGKRVWEEVLKKPLQTPEELAKLLDDYAKKCFF